MFACLDSKELHRDGSIRGEIAVSRTTDFVAELIRAANELEKQNDFERKRLLENALLIIQHLSQGLGHPYFFSTSETAFALQSVSTAITLGWASDAQVKAALLEAAETIRGLRVALDRKSLTQPTEEKTR